jgi:hypothetical protein
MDARNLLEVGRMAVRREWTEWHLTPRGWQPGSTRREGAGTKWTDEPEDRVLTCVFQELQGNQPPDTERSTEETWRSKKGDNLDDLLKQYGSCPERL